MTSVQAEESDPLKVLVLDAGAFITQAKFDQFGPDVKYVTLAAVVQRELKDENARRVHQNFPYPIETRIPSEEAVNAIADFAKKTGDFPNLSSVDIQVLALCYMFERERNGMKRIRTAPAKRIIPTEKKVVAAPPDETLTVHVAAGNSDSVDGNVDPAEEETGGFEEGERSEVPGLEAPAVTEPPLEGTPEGTEPEGTGPENSSEAADPFGGDDEGEWITPQNINQYKHRTAKSSIPLSELSDVGCITTDFAMQNVLISMGLRLLSVTGLSITSLLQHVRRCHACWAVEWNMEKANNFCRNCGGHTLLKAVLRIDEDGVPSYSMSQKAIYNKRGTVYSIPKFRGGRHNTDLILREDAMKNTPRTRPKKEEDAFEDSVEFGWANTAQQQNFDQFGYGRRNPNVVVPGKRDKNKRNHRKK